MKQGLGIREQGFGLRLVRKPVASVGVEGLREATTGRVVMMPRRPAKLVVLPKVWAVAEGQAHVQPKSPGLKPLASDGLIVGLTPHANPEAGTVASPKPDEELGVPAGAPAASVTAPEQEVAFYRKYTEAMLRRYMKMAMEAGRVPSFMGRELFRGNVTHCKVESFEDVVIFCHDMERHLARLNPLERELVKRIALQQYSQGEAAAALGMSLRSCITHYMRSLDRLTKVLLECRMLEPAKCCQEAAKAPSAASC